MDKTRKGHSKTLDSSVLGDHGTQKDSILSIVRLQKSEWFKSLDIKVQILLEDCLESGFEEVFAKWQTESSKKSIQAPLLNATPIAEPKIKDVKESQSPEEVLRHIGVALRKLVAQEAPWSKIKLLILKWINLENNEMSYARAVELAALNAPTDEMIHFLKSLVSSGASFYPKVHENLRSQILLLLWQCQEHSLARSLLNYSITLKNTKADLNIEKLYIMLQLVADEEHDRALLFFKHHEAECFAAFRTYKSQIIISEDEFRLMLAKIALKQKMKTDAARIAKGITADSVTFEEAQSLVELQEEFDYSLQSAVNEHIQNILLKNKWQDKLHALEVCLNLLVSDSQKSKVYLGVLMRVLAEPWDLLNDSPAAMRELSRILWKYRAVALRIENWWTLFADAARNFSNAEFENSIWSFVAHEDNLPNSSAESLWYAVASLHYGYSSYLLGGFKAIDQNQLWLARDYWIAIEGLKLCEQDISWDQLIDGIKNTLRSNSIQGQTAELKLVAAFFELLKTKPNASDLADVWDALNPSYQLSSKTWSELKTVVASQTNHLQFKKLMWTYFKSFYPSNHDLELIWKHFAKDADFDTCWRSASILASRGMLAKNVESAWQVCGESRSFYSFNDPNEKQILALIKNYSFDEQRFLKALMTLAPSMGELFVLGGLAESTAHFLGFAQNHHSEFKKEVDDALNSLSTFKGTTGMMALKSLHHRGVFKIPDGIEVFPSNHWTEVLFRCSSRLGIGIWSWKVSILSGFLQELLTSIASRTDATSYSSKLAKWLRSLSSEKRTAWSELPGLCKKLNDQQVFELLMNFLCKLAILIYPSHYLALQSMRTMRLSEPIIRDIESWLLSEEYIVYRNKSQTQSRVPVSKNLIDAHIIRDQW